MKITGEPVFLVFTCVPFNVYRTYLALTVLKTL